MFFDNERDPNIGVEIGSRSLSQSKEFKYPKIGDSLMINPFKKNDETLTKKLKRKILR